MAAAEEAMTAARLATIHANSALAAARLALDLETRIGRDSPALPAVTTSFQTCITEMESREEVERVKEVVEVKKVEEDNNLKEFLTPGRDENIIDVDDEDDEIEDNQDEDNDNDSTDENVIECPERPERVQRTQEYCRNCKLLKGKCLHGKFVLNVLKKTVGMKVAGCGFPSYFWGRVGTVIGGRGDNVKIRWSPSSFNSYRLRHGGMYSFKYSCTDTQKVEKERLDLCCNRLPFEEGVVWRHDQDGEKHRIRFSATDNITLTGISLMVQSTIRRVTFNLCQETDRRSNDHFVIFKEDFYDVNPSTVSSGGLRLRRGVSLSCDRIYLLVLTLHGGASQVRYGGEEFLGVPHGEAGEEVLLKFEDYHHRTDRRGQATSVERGLVDKIYFQI